MREVRDKLYQNGLFEGLSAEQVEAVLPCTLAAIKRYGEGTPVPAGSGCEEVGVVLEGSLGLYGPSGAFLGSLGEGDLLGGDCFCETGPVGQEIRAESEAQVLYLSGAFFLLQCAKQCKNKGAHELVVRNMLRLLSKRAAAMSRKIAYLTAEDLKAKIAMYLCELYELNRSETFAMPLNRDRLAAFFAVARPSLSRELAGLKNQGVIDFYRSQVTILDLPRLRGIAQGREG